MLVLLMTYKTHCLMKLGPHQFQQNLIHLCHQMCQHLHDVGHKAEDNMVPPVEEEEIENKMPNKRKHKKKPKEA